MQKKIDYSLYVITDESIKDIKKLIKVVEAAILGGATMVQYRNKNAPAKVLIEQARQFLAVARKYNIPLIINDRIDVALAVGAEGVHLGQDDMPVSLAKKMLNQMSLREAKRRSNLHRDCRASFHFARNDNNGFIIGISVKTVAQAKQAEKDGADYLGVGDIFGTQSKHDAGKPIGITMLERIAKSVSIPIIGIGGINADNALSVIQAGAKGIAVISAISKAKDPKKAARELLAEINSGIRNNE